jgi:transcriptional regulator with XRE-family HTH domain
MGLKVRRFDTCQMEKTLYSRQYQVMVEMLRQCRVSADVTQTQLASELGITQSEVSKCELGTRRLDVIELNAWLAVLGKGLVEFTREFTARLESKFPDEGPWRRL